MTLSDAIDLVEKLHIDEGDVVILKTPHDSIEIDVEIRNRLDKLCGGSGFVLLLKTGWDLYKLPEREKERLRKALLG